MKIDSRKKSMTFGEFVAQVYDIWGERKARGFVRFAVKSRLVEFRGQQRFVIS